MNPDQGQVLLKLARGAIEHELGLGPKPLPAEPWLSETGASFVTLTQNGRLRGCMGTIEAHRPLGDDVRSNALAAAFGDPRFSPLREDEVRTTRVEVSVLSATEPLPVRDEADALAKLRPGVDGIVFECGGRRATFLPQVWEDLADPKDFLAHLKLKAGLAADFWAADVRLFRYTCEKWKEARV